MSALKLLAAERQRQIEAEGWTAQHDALHQDGELAAAAGCYALAASLPDMVRDHHRANRATDPESIPAPWPWDPKWWKPGADNSRASRIRELVKSGALILAAIDALSEQRDAVQLTAADRGALDDLIKKHGLPWVMDLYRQLKIELLLKLDENDALLAELRRRAAAAKGAN